MPDVEKLEIVPPKGVRPPLLGPGHDLGTVTDRIAGIVLQKHTPVFWLMIFGVAAMLFGILNAAIGYLFFRGTGIWGINIPAGWGFAIINFVWWIGIGHAGTLISAILLLFKQTWRTSINRFAEAMTIFAVMQAGLFPLIHTGRPWLAAYWLFPIPLTMGVWPQFRSPLIWDVFAVSTYFTVSLLFWGIGLIPDFATLRDSAKTLVVRRIYGMLAMGWRGFITLRHLQKLRQSDAGNRSDRRLQLCFRGLLRLVQSGQIRTGRDVEPHDRPLCRLLLDVDTLQHHSAAVALVQHRPLHSLEAFYCCDHCEHRNVAGALRDHHYQLAARFPPLIMGHVLVHQVGLDDPAGNHGVLYIAVLPVHTIHARHLDF